MKKFSALTVIALALIGTSYTAMGQGSYARAGGGYSLGVLKTDWSDLYPFMGITGEQQKLEAFSLGEGFHAGGSYGHKINPHLGVELGVSYFGGSRQSFDMTATLLSFEDSEDGREPVMDVGTVRTGFEVRMWQFAPAVVLEAGFEKLNPYGRLGLIMGIGTVIQTVDAEFAEFSSRSRQERTGGLHLGIAAGLGVQYPLNERWSLYAECTFIGLEMTPEKGKTTRQEINGVDAVDGLSTNVAEVIYTDDYLSYGGQEDPDQPRREPRTTFPVSGIGLQAGLVVHF